MSEIVRQLTQYPDALDNPYGLLGTASLGVAYLGYQIQRHRIQNDISIDFANPVGLQHVIDTAPNRRLSGGLRLRATLGGAALVLGSVWLAEPQATQTVDNPDSSTFIVMDESYSMIKTADMDNNATRYDAMSKAITAVLSKDKVPKGHNVGIITFGADVQVMQPLTTDRATVKPSIENLSVNPNGGDVLGALKLAVDLSTRDSKKVILISDGTIDNRPEIEDLFKKAEQTKVDVEVIVPGRNNSTYQLSNFGEKVNSGIKSEVFSMAAKDHIHTVTGQQDAEKVITSAVNNVAKTKHRQFWKPIAWATIADSVAFGALLTKDFMKRLAISRMGKR